MVARRYMEFLMVTLSWSFGRHALKEGYHIYISPMYEFFSLKMALSPSRAANGGLGVLLELPKESSSL